MISAARSELGGSAAAAASDAKVKVMPAVAENGWLRS